MSNSDFPVMSYNEYETMIENIISTRRYCDYSEVSPDMNFIVLRHDVEFSPERAYKIQEIENKFDFKSSYFFQITNNTYNAFSGKNSGIIKEIYSNGHRIGLHYHLNGKTDLKVIEEDIKFQSRIMSEMLGIQIDRFSFHRPTNEVLKSNINIEGLINTYSPLFFTFADKMTENVKLEVKYAADSMHMWKYGFPNNEMFRNFNKIQILIHPFSWTPAGYDNLDNFKTLIQEKDMELKNSI